ncbi:EAL domain-containing response regulator [Algiphilus sp. NNCM1]|uniref:EAL domain-containing response regulator n=1 Tax=Algiphilus sp. TaxID=1872431 RepID=UPI001CA6103B|nr:EAL domain-containing response regulator [Algiphilus sp.]MBY8964158.1 EAL domain-containing response regulator [Algiphilus acroporae]MCI5064065.1 EAL domain-containing response regulator [Algiphilus sp.]MCI5105041.1 EAL domain-containing response regulator [Algiphilus sp.]
MTTIDTFSGIGDPAVGAGGPSARTTPQDLAALIIDDAESVRLSLAQMLKRHGIDDVYTAGDGATGLTVIECLRGRDCIVFCDLAMPGMDGVEVVREIQRLGYPAAIVLVSGKDRRVLDIVSKVARDAGHSVVGAMAKPFAEEQVADLLRLARLGRHTAQPPPRATDAAQLSVDALRAAIDEERIAVVVEPQMRLKDGALVAMEALARIETEGGLIAPFRFIPVAEASGLINPLTRQLMRKLFREVYAWHQRGRMIDVSVNLSTSLLVEPAMPSIILDTAVAAGVGPQHIMIELTESTAAQHRIEDVIESVARFRLKDFRVAIDDFGTGQSTLERLQRIPFTDLKVDRSFVTGAATDDDKRGIIEYSVQLAHRLGLNVIAEGVETAADQEEVGRLGCEMAQGYYYARPLPLDQVEGWIAQWNARAPRGASRN